MLDIQPKARGCPSLNSCTGQRKDEMYKAGIEKNGLFASLFPFCQRLSCGNVLHCHSNLNICFWLSLWVLELCANRFHRMRNTLIWEWTKILTLLQKAEIPLLMHIKVKSCSMIVGPWNCFSAHLFPPLNRSYLWRDVCYECIIIALNSRPVHLCKYNMLKCMPGRRQRDYCLLCDNERKERQWKHLGGIGQYLIQTWEL